MDEMLKRIKVMTYLDREEQVLSVQENFSLVKEWFILSGYRLDFNLFYQVKKYLIFLGKKYLIDTKDIEVLVRKAQNLDEIIIKLQILKIAFGNYKSVSTYQSAANLYDDFRKILLNKDHLKKDKKRYVHNYVCYIAKVVLEEMNVTKLESDAWVLQFKQFMNLVIKAFIDKQDYSLERRAIANYVDNSNIVRYILTMPHSE